ncbi:MAG: membrane protein insertion efficiency factor YidD [Clostridia bacterium]|nr:membrane protein insertion efficiency factor YidD [Clostridia bacterium]
MKSFLIYLIRSYRQLRPDRAPCCRYTPSCSEYAIQAISLHGAAKGILLSLWRLLRCNPFSKGGWDPVPERGKWSNRAPASPEQPTYERNPR